jgi:putative SOS response-associated peptidase YedK
MCCRFTLILDPGGLEDEFDLGGIAEDYTLRYNIAPTQPVGVVRDATTRTMEMFRWGLIPSWAKDMEIGNKLINARCETLQEKPSFRSPLAKRRNLILSSGFFEWKKPGEDARSGKEPVFIHLKNQRAFAFAGLWDEWLSPDGQRIHSTTIITCAANSLIGQFHDRMPVILDRENMWEWLNPALPPDRVQQMLLPFDSDQMEYYPVSPMVNNPRIDKPECILPVERLF